MRSAAIYTHRSSSEGFGREALIIEQLDPALAACAELERHDLGRVDKVAGEVPAHPLPGLATVRSCDPIVALGTIAHAALADFEKRTLLVSDLDLGGPREKDLIDDVESFVWSCTNTLRIVALGSGAWHSVQLLPIADRRFHAVPPLRFGAPPSTTSSVLVIDHEGEGTQARALVDALARAGTSVRYSGKGDETCWSNDASIHVHVGDHTLDAEEPRLVDSWRSERLALQLIDRRARRTSDADVLMIEEQVNGIICGTPLEVVAACRELRDDRVLRQKLVAAGQATVSPLLAAWGAIAKDLLPYDGSR